MLKKFGMVTVGVTAGLLAVAPAASAHEGHDKGHDNGHHKSSSKNIDCSAEGGDVKGNEGAGAIGLGSALDGNAGQILSCNSFLNDNLNDNEVGVDIAGGLL